MKSLWACDPACQRKLPNPKETIDEVMVHVNTFLSHGSLPTRIEIQVLPEIKYIQQTLVATSDNLDTFGTIIARSDWPEADAYSLLTYENDQAGTVGIAMLGQVCSSPKQMRRLINEYHTNEIITAQAS